MNQVIIKSFHTLLFCLLVAPVFSQKVHDAKKRKETKKQSNIASSNLSSTVAVAANPSLKGSGFKEFLIGKNYRKEWTTPVQVPVLNFKTAYGGLTPEKKGGGKETHSLKVGDKTGREWSLRSVAKYPDNAIPPDFRKTAIASVVRDAVSASYPYGVLSMSVLSKAARVPYLKNTLTYIPDDPVLGKFRGEFKNTQVLMEERDPQGITIAEGEDEDKTISTEELVYKLAKSSKNTVDERAALRARLLDNFVMDFDRHEGQWDWGAVKTNNKRIYFPIPKDRDQVFYTNQGLLPRLARSKGLFPELQGFRAKAKNIRTFNRTARNFDRFFLTELSAQDWQTEIDQFLQAMTDDVIDAALRLQPKEIQSYAAVQIASTLKKKRAYFKADMMKYYRYLSERVAVVGTNNNEDFLVNKLPDGKVSIVVRSIDSSGNISDTIYQRLFDPHDTREVRLYGLEGDDRFEVNGGYSKIKIRMVGGPGNDTFTGNSTGGKALAYDVKFEQNKIENSGIHKKFSSDPQNNTYTRLGNNFSFISPGISLEYSVDGGLFLGPKLKITTRGFRKDPYSMNHVLIARRAINSSSYHFIYRGDIVRIFKNTDLQLRGELWLPTSRTGFYGMGNDTKFDKTKPGKQAYYFARYDLGNFSILANHTVSNWLQIKYGGIFQYLKLKNEENRGLYVSQYFSGMNNAKTLYNQKYYAGGQVSVEVNTTDDKVMPTTGVELNAYARTLKGLNTYSHSFSEVGGAFTFYKNIVPAAHLILASSFGAGHNIGNFEFEQAQYLGFKQNLRGYRIQRFAGRTRAYNNTELRWKIADVNAYLFPAAVGVLAFNDLGRVWTDGEKSTTWHDGYGAGIWIAPLNRLVVTTSLTYSSEEKNLVLLTFGFQF